jgi:GntR family transcriptional regulator
MLSVDKMSRKPIYEQIIEGVEELIARGEFTAGDQLPSVRTLAVQLAVNPNTLQKAYAELERRGLCRSVPGSGRFIAPEAGEAVRALRHGRLAELASMTQELRRSGVPLNEILECVRQSYGGPEGPGEG